MNQRSRTAKGFTIIELMLSMSFIAVMLITIALCVIQISTIYARGETLRQVNQAVRTIGTDIENTIATVHPFDIDQSAIEAGRLCTGQYSYVWNTPTTSNGYTDAGGEVIRFVRVSDPNQLLCDNLSSSAVKADAVELMEAGDRALVVRSFAITPVADDALTGQRLYTLTLLLGTDNTAAIDTTSNQCRPPADSESDLTYCAINEFTLTVRAGVR